MPLASEKEARAYVAGKRVAVVANAPEILDHFYGEQIDSSDLVLRMNRAFPEPTKRQALGMRTDILTGGVIEPLVDLPFVPSWIWWFKHTQMGDAHLGTILRWPSFHSTRILHVAREILDPVTAEIGMAPSSGPAAIATLQALGALSIDVYGLSCWGMLEPGKTGHWWRHDARYAHLENGPIPHAVKQEAEWLKKKLKRVSRLHWEVVA